MSATTIADTEARFEPIPTAAQVDADRHGDARQWAGPPVGRAVQLGRGPARALGGENLAPSPTAYLLGALAGCAVAFLHDTLAPEFDVQIDDVTAVARCSTDLRGLLGIDGVAPDLGDIELDITVSSPSPDDRIEAMLDAWRERCPIYLALLKPQSIALTVSTGSSA